MDYKGSKEEIFLRDCLVELAQAKRKFPKATFAMIALMEEVGELAQAKLKLHSAVTKEDHPNIRARRHKVYEEATQVVAMVLRVVFEEDLSMFVDYSDPGT